MEGLLFRRILVPVDFTRKTRRAIDVALRLARSQSARTTLLHVIERIQGDESDAFRSFYDSLEKSALKKMKPLAREFSRRRLPVTFEIIYGNRVAQIVRSAERGRTELIVMNSHSLKQTPITEHWATISYKVAVLARCPVLLVK
jgi:nucleotide-binding universal stress UspA family protein